MENGYLTTNMSEELQGTTGDSLFAETQRQWDEDILRDICNTSDYELIKQILIPVRSKPDSWYWLFDEEGKFTIKS